MLTIDKLILAMDFVSFEERQRLCTLLPYKFKSEKGRQAIINYLDVLLANFREENLRSKIIELKTGIILITAMEEIYV